MEIDLGSLVPINKLESDIQSVFDVVEKYGRAILLKDNQPAYIIIKASSDTSDVIPVMPQRSDIPRMTDLTLHEAMQYVLKDAENHTLHASKLADEIYTRGLYYKKNGEKAQYTQIRARCGHHKDLFDTLPGNYIRLKTKEE